MEKRNIIFVQNIEYPQQWAVDIFYYSKLLSKYDNYKITVICSKINEDISNKNLNIIEIWNTNYLRFVFKAFFQIKNISKKNNIDYVYFFAQHPFSVLLQFFVKYFLWIETIYDIVSWPIWKWIIPFISQITIKLWVYFSNKYVVINNWLIKKLNLSKIKKYKIISMWYDEELFFEKKWYNLFNKKKNEIIFTYIWTLNKERNLDIFIKAFIKNLKINRNIKLYFIWYGNWEKILKNISWNYLNKNIFFLWKKEHKKISDYINSSDIMVSYVPKVDYFNFQPPTKLIEYLACNKPVICTNTIAQTEIINWFSELIHNDDINNTTKKIKYIINNFDKVISKDYIWLVKEYSWKKLTYKLYLLLKNT